MSTELAVRSGGSLAITTDQTEWTEQQIAVLRSVGVSEDVSPAELSAFLHETQRTGLDPFLKQIYLIGRFDKRVGRDVYRSQTGIDGYRVVAHRAAARDRVELEYDDTLWCGADGVWREMWIWDNPPLAAKVVVRKNGKAFPGIATLKEYGAFWPDGNPKDMWKRMPANQLAKCAEALALRKGFPQDLSGIYTDVEMQQSDDGQQATVRVEQVQPDPRTEAVAAAGSGRVQRTHVDAPAPADAAPRMATSQQKQMIAILFKDKLNADREEKLRVVSGKLNRTIASTGDMFYDEAQACINWLGALPNFPPPAQSSPTATDSLFEEFKVGIEGSASVTELNSVATGIGAAFQAHKLTEADRKTLIEVWTERNKVLLDQAQMVSV